MGDGDHDETSPTHQPALFSISLPTPELNWNSDGVKDKDTRHRCTFQSGLLFKVFWACDKNETAGTRGGPKQRQKSQNHVRGSNPRSCPLT